MENVCGISPAFYFAVKFGERDLPPPEVECNFNARIGISYTLSSALKLRLELKVAKRRKNSFPFLLIYTAELIAVYSRRLASSWSIAFRRLINDYQLPAASRTIFAGDFGRSRYVGPTERLIVGAFGHGEILPRCFARHPRDSIETTRVYREQSTVLATFARTVVGKKSD